MNKTKSKVPPKKSVVKKVKAWIHKDHMTQYGRAMTIKAQEVFYGSRYEGLGWFEFTSAKPRNPDFIPVTISYILPKPSKKQ